jgi:tetraacyldisaccharide 4'-kinase
MTGSRLLAPLAALYGGGVGARLALYRAGIFRVRRAARPVISVGNLAAGGAGKTPFVRWLAGELLARGERPAILTRGYGRRSRGLVVVSDGAGTIAPPHLSGDEPAVLARALPRVPVVADARRLRASERALAIAPDVSLFLLDDGFSHVALSRDVDIVLLDATAPDAGGSLLPAGRLREPLKSLARADFVVVTKAEQTDPGPAFAFAARHAPGVPVFHAVTEVTGVFDGHGEPLRPMEVGERAAVAVSGLAHPEAFAATLAALGIRPAAFLAFRDHVRYGGAEIGRIERAVEETGAGTIVTTEKDAVKLESICAIPLVTVAVRMRVVEPDFTGALIAQLSRRPS